MQSENSAAWRKQRGAGWKGGQKKVVVKLPGCSLSSNGVVLHSVVICKISWLLWEMLFHMGISTCASYWASLPQARLRLCTGLSTHAPTRACVQSLHPRAWPTSATHCTCSFSGGEPYGKYYTGTWECKHNSGELPTGKWGYVELDLISLEDQLLDQDRFFQLAVSLHMTRHSAASTILKLNLVWFSSALFVTCPTKKLTSECKPSLDAKCQRTYEPHWKSITAQLSIKTPPDTC